MKAKDNQTLAKHICIYCKKSNDEVTFNSRDHIIPKGLGGKRRLDKGYVCDTCNNNLLSTLEQFMLRDSILSIPRMFLGPGSEGRMPNKRNDVGKIVLMKPTNQDIYELGVMVNTKPILIDQMLIQLTENSLSKKGSKIFCKLRTSLDENEGKEIAFMQNFFHAMSQYKNKEIKLFFKEIPINDYILAIHRGKYIVACNPDGNVELVKEFIGKVNLSNSIESEKIEPEKRKSNTEVITGAQVNNKLERGLMKICINLIAKEKGHDEILSSKFNQAREFVTLGAGENLVHLLGEDNKPTLGHYLFQFPEEAHQIFILNTSNGLYGFVAFYGKAMRFSIKICGDIDTQYNSPIGILCDWRNGKETLLSEYFITLSRRTLQKENDNEEIT